MEIQNKSSKTQKITLRPRILKTREEPRHILLRANLGTSNFLGVTPTIFRCKVFWKMLKMRLKAHTSFSTFGPRLPVQLPPRITDELCAVLTRHNVRMMNTHVNHPKEITHLLSRRLGMFRKAGVILGNQSVLLKGVNDSVAVQRELGMKLVAAYVPITSTPTTVPKAIGNLRFLSKR